MSDDHNDSDGRGRFPLLCDGNYPEWAIRGKALLVRKKLWAMIELPVKVADGAEPEVVEAAWEEAMRRRDKGKMAEAHAELVGCVSASELVHLDDDPAIAWANLAEVHRSQGLSTQLVIKRRMLAAVKEDTETMLAWVTRVKGIAAELRLVGAEVSELDTIIALTSGLGADYKPLVLHLDSLEDHRLTLKYVIACLLGYSKIDGVVDGAVNGSAYVAQGGGVGSGTGGGNGGVAQVPTCYRCGRSGHIRKFCPDRQQVDSGANAHGGAGGQGNAAAYSFAF